MPNFTINSRMNNLETRLAELENDMRKSKGIIRRYCPKCERRTITTEGIRDSHFGSINAISFMSTTLVVLDEPSSYTCEICGTKYKIIGNEEKFEIIEKGPAK